MTSRQFEYKGRHLEVRAQPDNDRYVVRVFENGVFANSIVYTVALEVASDAQPLNLVASLMELAESDFIRWSDWQSAQSAGQKSKV